MTPNLDRRLAEADRKSRGSGFKVIFAYPGDDRGLIEAVARERYGPGNYLVVDALESDRGLL